jgi:hypothetical protein
MPKLSEVMRLPPPEQPAGQPVGAPRRMRLSEVLAQSPDPNAEPGLEIEIIGGRRQSDVGAPVTGSTTSQATSGVMSAARNPANDSAFARMVSGQPPQTPQQRPLGEGNALTRFLGDIGGRNVLQGAYGLYGALGGDALNQYVLSPLDKTLGWGNQLGIGDRNYRQAAAELADEWGMARPETPTQRVLADIGEGLTGNALTLGVGGALNLGRQGVQAAVPTARNRLAEFLTAQPRLQAASTATGAAASGTTREQGGGSGAQLAAGLLGGLTPGALGYAGSAATRGALRGSSPAQVQSTLQDFGRMGTDPSVGQATGRRFLQGAENLLAGGPVGGGIISRFSERQSQDIGTGLQRIADNLSPGTGVEAAGDAIDRGVRTYRGNVRARRQALYWLVDRHIPDATPVPMANTWREVAALTTPTPGATATTGGLVNPRILQLRENLLQDLSNGGGQLPYSALRAIRTRVGEEMDAGVLQPDSAARQLSRVYGALSRDMEAAARAQGPAAEQAARRANDYTRLTSERLEQLQQVIDKNGGPENVYKAAIGETRDGGTTIRRVMQSLPPDAQRAVTAATVRRMGLVSPGAQDLTGEVFSTRTFLTNWNKLSSSAKRALFDRHGQSFVDDMNRVARVADNISRGAEVYRNPSGTANRYLAFGYWLGLVNAITQGQWKVASGLAGAGAGNAVIADGMTNPRFVRWLANSTALPAGTAPAQLQALRAMAEKDEDPELMELADALESEQRRQGQNNSANE